MVAEPSSLEAALAPYRDRSNAAITDLWGEWSAEHPETRFPSSKTMRRHVRLFLAGKRYRYAIALLAYEGLVGRAADDAIARAAVWLELYHLYTLFLDDIMDEDVRRRTMPSAWSANARLFPGGGQGRAARVFASQSRRYGVSQAILDALRLRSLAERAIQRSGLDVAARERLLRELTETDFVLSDGQGLDLDLEWARRIPEADYVAMSEQKTGRLYLASAATAAIAAEAAPEVRQALESYAGHFAVAFQDRDDLLGAGVVRSRIGGSAASDIAQGKRTRLYAIAWERLPPKLRAQFLRSYGRGVRTTSKDLELVRGLLRTYALPVMEARIGDNVSAAVLSLDSVPFADGRAKDLLSELARDQTTRDR